MRFFSKIIYYIYDHENNRLFKNTSNEDTYYADDSLIRVVNSTGTYDTVYYYHNGVLVAKNETNNSEISYYHPDHLGSTTKSINI